LLNGSENLLGLLLSGGSLLSLGLLSNEEVLLLLLKRDGILPLRFVGTFVGFAGLQSTSLLGLQLALVLLESFEDLLGLLWLLWLLLSCGTFGGGGISNGSFGALSGSLLLRSGLVSPRALASNFLLLTVVAGVATAAVEFTTTATTSTLGTGSTTSTVSSTFAVLLTRGAFDVAVLSTGITGLTGNTVSTGSIVTAGAMSAMSTTTTSVLVAGSNLLLLWGIRLLLGSGLLGSSLLSGGSGGSWSSSPWLTVVPQKIEGVPR